MNTEHLETKSKARGKEFFSSIRGEAPSIFDKGWWTGKVMEIARVLRVPLERYEFHVLCGMAEPVRKGLRTVAERVRLYCPYGELLPGMAYLVRRLLENTANESLPSVEPRAMSSLSQPLNPEP